MGSMDGRVVFVTGASDGIGKATALRLGREGAHVVLAARTEDRLREVAQEIEGAGGAASWCVVDIMDAAALTGAIERVARDHGRLDGLVNNASAVGHGMIETMGLSDWRRTFSGGVDAVFVGIQAFLKAMKGRNAGSIVNISSVMGRRGVPAMGAYSSSKAAIEELTRTAAVEAAAFGVRVNCVTPGLILTPGTEAFFASAPEEKQRAEAEIPLGRGGRPEEIANAITFLLSDEASYVTGLCMEVDGGRLSRL